MKEQKFEEVEGITNTSAIDQDQIDSFIIRPVPVPFSVFSKSRIDPLNRQCSICFMHFKSEKGLKQHMGKRHPTKEKTIKCNLCIKSFYNKHALKFHVNQVHLKITRTRCTFCQKVYYNKYTLKEHHLSCHKLNN